MKQLHNLLSTIIKSDSYKASQFKQYPPDTEYINSYVEARGGMKESVFFGLQAWIQENLLVPITKEDVDFAEMIITSHGEPFNREGWDLIVNEFDGFLPLRIEAVPEGMVLPTGNIQVQVVNTDPRFAWLTSYIETSLLRGVWYPSTVATKSREMKRHIAHAAKVSADDEFVDFKLHDFGARGASSSETAALGGMAHLINFQGTDTMEALIAAKLYYDIDMAGFSIPASEHSTMTSWGPEREKEAYENMLDKFSGDGKMFACVSDSYDIFNACRNIWGKELAEKVKNSGGTLVVRPDSGNPLIVPIKVVEILMEVFGYKTNSKGYKVLPEFIRVIQGDGLNSETLPQLLNNLEQAGLSLENIAFGMGGGLLQDSARDDLKYAMKASARRDSAGKWHDVYKDPVHGGKTSKKGRLGLVFFHGIGSSEYRTVRLEDVEDLGENLLRKVYENGIMFNRQTFEDVRKNAKV